MSVLSKLGRILKRIVQVVAAVIVVLLIGGVVYELIASTLEARRFAQQGKSIKLGAEFQNASLNLICSGPPQGSGGPTVILDSGLGVPAVGWQLVQAEVAKFARVCSYDRAGYGWSSAGVFPRTSLQIAMELHALLETAGEKGPYVLVGHSFGGYNVRVYTGQYPQDVVGLVLVDTSHEDQVQRMPPSMRAAMNPPSDNVLLLASVLRHLGIARAISSPPTDTKLSQEQLQQIQYLERSAKFTAAAFGELRAFDESARQVRAAGTLGDRPLIVLTAGKAQPAEQSLPGVTQKDLDEMRRLWVDELQVSQMHLSTRGQRTIVTDSSHMIPFERPDAVAAAIREVWEAARAPR